LFFLEWIFSIKAEAWKCNIYGCSESASIECNIYGCPPSTQKDFRICNLRGDNGNLYF